MMQADGVLAAILPEATRLDRLQRLITLEPAARPSHRPPLPQAAEGRGGGGGSPDAIRRLAALLQVDAEGAVAAARRLRLSKAERDRLAGLAPPWPIDPAGDDRGQRRALYRLGAERFRDLALLAAADDCIGEARLDELLDLADSWKPLAFPLAGRDVTAIGIPPGPRVGQLLAELRDWWEAGDFAADRAACLKKLKEVAGWHP